jgi:hypothetical protein
MKKTTGKGKRDRKIGEFFLLPITFFGGEIP